jgi:GNAT superfamily N-acetyltransferase
MSNRRTTVVARDEDLAMLAHEARARGLSLGRMLGEVVAERAEELRHERRPRLATFRADASIAKAAEEENPATRPFRMA